MTPRGLSNNCLLTVHTARYAHLDDGFVGDAAVRVSRTLGRAVGMGL